MSNEPTANIHMAKPKGKKPRVYRTPRTNEEATGSTQPTLLRGCYQPVPFDISAATKHDVAGLDPVPRKANRISFADSGDSFGFDSPIQKIDRHDRRNSVANVVGCVKLTPERAGLYNPATSFAKTPQSSLLPFFWRIER